MRAARFTGYAVALIGALAGAVPAQAAAAGYSESPIVEVSAACSGQNAEVEQAADTKLGYVYEAWMGCSGIGFARSTDGGKTFEKPISLPGASGSNVNAWDPAVTVAPDGTVYAAFMIAKGSQWYPVVDASFDHGTTFPQVSPVVPPDAKNWGDRDFLAVGPDGTVYLTYDYGPERTSVTFICATNGSCAFSTGDLNVVLQRSTDGGQTWSPMVDVSPGFPASGGDSAPMVVEPSGRIDVLYQGYHITDTTTFAMDPAYSYFTSSTDQGSTWSTPVRVGPEGGTMSLAEWWIDGDIGIDAGGNLYATWDTQSGSNDTGWLAFSTDGGKHWSGAIQVPADRLNVPHIMEVAGGASGTAYVGWLTSSTSGGYTQYLRAFSTRTGWLSDQFQVSSQFGDTAVWPGDTFGISAVAPGRVVLSWGSATPTTGKKSQIFAAAVTVT
ncbi:MAG TPA: sialidase family protein [Candidatus Dormibacteraeota bacterium]|nr:sialidase family protein [Candidatus Dormibacteraeota bacterium]